MCHELFLLLQAILVCLSSFKPALLCNCHTSTYLSGLRVHPGTRLCSLSTHFIQRCPKSTGSQYIIGQPPTRQLIFSRSHSRAASAETLPSPKERCNQTWRIPSSAHSRTIFTATSGGVTIITASTGSGRE